MVKKNVTILFLYFTFSVFVGSEPVRKTYKQNKGASQQNSYRIKMIRLDRGLEVCCLNHSATTLNLLDKCCFQQINF